MTTIHIMYDVSEDAEQYLETSARLRGISRTKLVNRILDVVLKDKLIQATLDDDTTAVPPREKHAKPPKDKVFDATPRPSYYVPPRKVGLSKSELRAQLTEAVINTGGRRMSRVERKAKFVQMLRDKGRLCFSDMGDQTQQQSWFGPVRELLDAGIIFKNEPELRTRRVYYELRLPTSAPTPDDTPPQSTSAVGDHSPEEIRDLVTTEINQVWTKNGFGERV